MQLQQELLDEGMRLLARKKDFPVVLTDEANNLVQHQLWERVGTAVNIVEVKVPGVLPDQFISYFRNQSEILQFNKTIHIHRVD